MMAGRFHRFYDSLAKHLVNLRARRLQLDNEEHYDNDYDIETLTFKQFVGPTLQFISFLLIPLLLFLIEVIVYHCGKRRNQRNMHLQRQRQKSIISTSAMFLSPTPTSDRCGSTSERFGPNFGVYSPFQIKISRDSD